uniref:AC5 n=1 Tax=Siegesbeckia yellow vein virus TaxID=371401 RepID=U5ZHZ2_9GEMI|nr:AC5 [Siegesbeckia yellow vein virus]
MIFRLNILIHPDFTQHVNRLNTKPLTHTMSQPTTTGNIRHTNYFTYMGYIMTLFKRLNLTWTFTTTRNIRAFVHSVHPGLSVHGPIDPCSLSVGDKDSWGSSTAAIWAVEVQPPTYLGGGSGNDYICRSLGHNLLYVIYV